MTNLWSVFSGAVGVMQVLVLLTSSRLSVGQAIQELLVDKPVSRVNQGENGTLECRAVPPNVTIPLFEWIFNATGETVYEHNQAGSFSRARGHLIGRSNHGYNRTTGVYTLHIENSTLTVDDGIYHCKNTGSIELRNTTIYEVLLPTTAGTTIDTAAADQTTTPCVTQPPTAPPNPAPLVVGVMLNLGGGVMIIWVICCIFIDDEGPMKSIKARCQSCCIFDLRGKVVLGIGVVLVLVGTGLTIWGAILVSRSSEQKQEC